MKSSPLGSVIAPLDSPLPSEWKSLGYVTPDGLGEIFGTRVSFPEPVSANLTQASDILSSCISAKKLLAEDLSASQTIKLDGGIDPALLRLYYGDVPRRYIVGIDPARPTHHQPKEKIMTVDRKDFVAAPVNVAADSLAQKHIGSLVTVTLPSGAEITDILTGVRSGLPARRSDASINKVVVTLQNVGLGFDSEYLQDRHGEHVIEPKSILKVRRPRPAPAAKKTAKR